MFHVFQLPGGLAVLDVVGFCEPPIERQDLLDGQIPDGAGGADRLRAPIDLRVVLGAPFGNCAFVMLVTLVAAVGTEIVILAIDPNDGLARGFVMAVGGYFSGFARAWAGSPLISP